MVVVVVVVVVVVGGRCSNKYVSRAQYTTPSAMGCVSVFDAGGEAVFDSWIPGVGPRSGSGAAEP